MEVLECDIASLIGLVPFPFVDMCHTLRNVANDARLNFDGLGCKVTLGPMHARVEEQAPFQHPRALRPTAVNGL